MIFGNTNEFAIESVAWPSLPGARIFGRIRLWVGGASVGDLEQTSVISSLQTEAEGFLIRSREITELAPRSLSMEDIRSWIEELETTEWELPQARRVSFCYRDVVFFAYAPEGLAAARVIVIPDGDQCVVTAWERDAPRTTQVRLAKSVVDDAISAFVHWKPNR